MQNIVHCLLAAVLLLTACGEGTTPEFVLNQTRPLALKISPPEAQPGDTVTAKLILAGTDFRQNSTLDVMWLEQQELKLPYTNPLSLPLDEKAYEEISSSTNLFTDEGFADIPVTATVTITTTDEYGKQVERTVRTQKLLRLWKPGILSEETRPLNPEIQGVTAHFKNTDDTLQTQPILNENETVELSFTVHSLPDLCGFSPDMTDMEQTRNSGFIYRWSFTRDHRRELEKRIELSYDRKLGREYLDTDMADESHEHVLFDLSDIQKEVREQPETLPARFTVFLVVRDRPDHPDGKVDYRFGLDVFHFDLVITADGKE